MKKEYANKQNTKLLLVELFSFFFSCRFSSLEQLNLQKKANDGFFVSVLVLSFETLQTATKKICHSTSLFNLSRRLLKKKSKENAYSY